MDALVRKHVGPRKRGGLAAFYLAMAYLIAMPYFLIVVAYPSVVDPVDKVALIMEHHVSLQAMYLITYVVLGIVLAVLSLALYRRLRDGAPALMQAATSIGLIWAVALVASGLVFNSGIDAVVSLHGADPSQAVLAWQAIEPVAQGLGGAGGELLGGLWVLLVSWAALRTGGLPKTLNWLGLGVGALGVLSVIPVLREAAYLFGLLQIAWLIWLGIAMMRPQTMPSALPAETAQVREIVRSAS